MLRICAFLAPDYIPRRLFEDCVLLTGPFAATFADPLAVDDAMAALRRYSLLDVVENRLTIHRLVQAVVRDHVPQEQRPA